ncbi:MAG TPA: LamG-like jellyroll fold domain-containing protein, partial [Solirubrobacteraceae bacterium]|nr:LamG-like jellyroll fold domain-containing protein [Solirubrobacteraceae bacterium]
PAVVHANQSITFNASGSSGAGGASIVDYKWDFNGDGTYETDAGSSPTITHTFTTAGSVTVGLQVTDSNGHTATTSHTITVMGALSGPYGEAVLGTAGLLHYWRLDESSGSQFADVVGGNTATVFGSLGSVTLGQSGAIVNDPDTAAAFDGVTGAAQAPVDLSGTSKLTIEFWLKWNKYENNDSLAMEFTPNFNEHSGGFLVDPNASDLGGTFAVGLGRNGSRNNVFFARPSAGVWHYYAFVLDATAAGASEITPYVDGQPVAYTKLESHTGAGPFANSTLNFMSRNAEKLFGAGTLDEVALYGQALSSEAILKHYEIGSGNPGPPPTASFTTEPLVVRANQSIAFNASASSGLDGASIVDYKWDFNGDGAYETDAGSSATITHAFTTTGTVTVGLQVTDSNGSTATASRTITVQEALSGPYEQAVLGTPGLLHYWRLDQTSGSQLADTVGGDAATILGSVGSVALGQPGALAGDSDTAAAFDGVTGAAQASVSLSATSKLTIEFWLKWDKFENNDSLAMELTPNFNQYPGGFLVDPDASDLGGTFAVGLGLNGSRNNAFFARPSAGVWHYYAFVLDTTAEGATEITPYVDGQPVPYMKTESRTGAGAFANSTLSFMSRNGEALFGAGTLDEVALYNMTLSPEAILAHYKLGTGT